MNLMKIAPGSNCLVFSVFGFFVKVALSMGAGRGLKREQVGENKAIADEFWNDLIASGKYFGGMFKWAPIGVEPNNVKALEPLLQILHARIDMLSPVTNPWAAIFKSSVDFLSETACTDRFIEALFAGEARASTHGDFCKSNCLITNGHPVLIDWGNFRDDFWAPYDIVHFDVVKEADRNGKAWRVILEDRIACNEMSIEQAARYALCRCELELQQDIFLNRLTLSRRGKYTEALGWAQGMVGEI